MAEVHNGIVGHLVLPGVHDGWCGIQVRPPLTVAFRNHRTHKRSAWADASCATLDGVDYRVVSVHRSAITDGFYVVVLSRIDCLSE